MIAEESAKPYFLRAFCEWCADMRRTPYIVARPAANSPSRYPREAVCDEKGRVFFDISPAAVRGLRIDKDGVFFTARFKGIVREVFVDISELEAGLVRETGQGLLFPCADKRGGAHAAPKQKSAPPSSAPKLRRV